MPGLLEGKVAVVAGGATAIGLATAKKLVAEGAHAFIGALRSALDINLKGTVFTLQKELPPLREGASVIVTTSIVGIKGQAGLVTPGA